jgi:hypothetical protein
MDFHSLVATNLAPPARLRTMDERAETRYYRDLDAIRLPRLRPLASVAAAAGLILLAISVAQA